MKKRFIYLSYLLLSSAFILSLLQFYCSDQGEDEAGPKSLIVSGSSLVLGAVNPSIDVELIPETGNEMFTDQAMMVENWEIQTGTSGLIVNSITKVSNTKITITFVGTVQDDTLSVVAKGEALSSGHESREIKIVYVKVGSTAAGLGLYHSKNLVEDAKAAVVVIHGLAEHSGRYNYITAKLNAAGYSVYRHDHRGHGQSDGARGHIDSWTELIEDANLMVDRAMQENPTIPVFMLGHSMGGLVTALYGITYPSKLDGQVLSAPALRDQMEDPPDSGNYRDRTDADVAASVASDSYTADPPMMVPNTLADTVCTDPDVRAAYDADPLNLKEFSYKLLIEMFTVGAHWVATHRTEYTYPTLILHGEADVIVPPQYSLIFFDGIASVDKQRKTYAGCYHEIINEKEARDATGNIIVVGKDSVIADIITWLEAHVDAI